MSGSVEPDPAVARPRRNPASGQVASLFQMAGREELSGVALVDLLGELGMTTAAARRLLARMREEGQLSAHRDGRVARYRLAGAFGARVTQLGRELGSEPPRWDGHFHALLFAVPESRRTYRDRLRRVATLVGYGVLQPGVLISVGDRSEPLTELIDACPADARVTRATIAVDVTEAARLAVPAWDLDDVARSLAAHATRLEDAIADDDHPAADGSTLRRAVELLNDVFIALVRDPRLPPELRPADWPLPRLLRAIGAVSDHYGTQATRFLQRRLVELGETAGPP